MNLQSAQRWVYANLSKLYAANEAHIMSNMLLEHITKLTATDRLIHSQQILSDSQTEQLSTSLTQLLNHRPIQYVLEEAYFYGLRFYVNEQVLIPRPETEELVQWICQSATSLHNEKPFKILDIGTGSGCIAISLKKNLANSEVHAIDISSSALEIAERNAQYHDTEIGFIQTDILDIPSWKQMGEYQIIVSNPPYVLAEEKGEMEPHVLQFEPHTALFVEAQDPLLYYRHIAHFGQEHLKNNGMLFLEINERWGKETIALLEQNGYSQIELHKDMQQKDRMVKCLFKK